MWHGPASLTGVVDRLRIGAPARGHARLPQAALIIWTIAYPVVSCSPLLIGASAGGGGAAAGGLVGLVLGATLFGPWIAGVIVLGILILLSR
jgi:hypothetical protein